MTDIEKLIAELRDKSDDCVYVLNKEEFAPLLNHIDALEAENKRLREALESAKGRFHGAELHSNPKLIWIYASEAIAIIDKALDHSNDKEPS